MEQLKSRWTDKVDKNCPLPEYPRPQLRRERWKNLNGKYNYAILPCTIKRPQRFQGEILVPFGVESYLSGVGKTLNENQNLWYERNFTVPETWKGERVLLNFGAVDWKCRIWVNQKEVGYHTGGYSPFTFDITGLLKDGDNTLTVKVYDPSDKGEQQRGKQSQKPGSIWYTATSGIWQTVWLEPVKENHIEKLWFVPDIDNNRVQFFGKSSLDQGEFNLQISFKGESKAQVTVKSGDWINLDDPKLWSPEEPNLYDVKVTLMQDGAETDTAETYFGMRKFSVGKDKDGISRLFLNNKPYFQRGLLDQGYWCESQLTPPTDESMVYDIEKMKSLGFNMLRKHIKVEPARWYYHCDRLGMIVWQDMVSGGHTSMMLSGFCSKLHITPKDTNYFFFGRTNHYNRKDFEKELFEMIDDLRFFTSIYCWVIFNEGWGQFDTVRLTQLVKEEDPTRVIDHASGWFDRGVGDLRSVHQYILPIPKVNPKDERVYVVSEYGGYSSVIDGHVFDKKRSFGYQMYKGKAELTAAYRKLMENQILPLVPKGLSGLVYTQLSDVELEVNGILTYDREEVKIDEDTIKELNEKLKY